ncbi:hypothetical protein Hdeb2414_s0017g00511401 [Helianthus debilis subsp. tardiflorus]
MSPGLTYFIHVLHNDILSCKRSCCYCLLMGIFTMNYCSVISFLVLVYNIPHLKKESE